VPSRDVIETDVLNQYAAAEEETRLLGTVENKLGMANWLKDEGHEWV
jgi:formate dehydrogenase